MGCDTRLRNKSNPISINPHFKRQPLLKADVGRPEMEGAAPKIHLLFFCKSLTYFPFLTTENICGSFTRELFSYQRILYRRGKQSQYKPQFPFPYSLGMLSSVGRFQPFLRQKTVWASCGPCTAPRTKLQVWIFSKRLFVIFGTSREAGGDYREEEAVLCSPPVKRSWRWKRSRRK